MDEKKICVREARVSDAEALCEIYAYYVKNTAITFETEVPSVAEFTDRICSIQAWYPYLVAECNGQILGMPMPTAIMKELLLPGMWRCLFISIRKQGAVEWVVFCMKHWKRL